jgi:hypothetical protein
MPKLTTRAARKMNAARKVKAGGRPRIAARIKRGKVMGGRSYFVGGLNGQ